MRRTVLFMTLVGAMCLLGGMTAPVRAQTVLTRISPVDTTGGLLGGKRLASGVQAWLGIPYAKPPVDKLRWEPPQPMHWTGVWDADRKMPECIQPLRPHDVNNYFGEEATSENCLYMNIWAPPGAHDGLNLPVIVFIYGGGYSIGSSGMALYSGRHVAAAGAVFVNFNYRLGILGFMAHPELTKEQGGHSGDYGLLDQRAALQWIQDNIRKFGGDPKHVLIMGQSAGAGSVTAQIFSPLSRGLFSAAAMSSACNWSSTGMMGRPEPTLAEAEQTGLKIQKLLGASSIQQMRQIPADRIMALQSEFQLGNNKAGVNVGPIIDGYFTPYSKAVILQKHLNSRVPIIASSNGDDLDSNFSPLANPVMGVDTVAKYKAMADRMYGANAAEFLKLYEPKSDSDVGPVARQAAEDGGFQGAAQQCAIINAKFNRQPTYIDLFTLKNPYVPGVFIADQNTKTIGAYHVADLAYWFGTLDAYNMFRPTRAWRPWDRTLSRDMMGALISFAKTGDPSTTSFKWPAWSPANQVRVVFGRSIHTQKLDVAGIEWLRAHPAKKIAIPKPAPNDRPFY